MNRQIAPDIKTIKSIKTGFPTASGRMFFIPSDEGVFKLDIVFPKSGYGVSENKFIASYAIDLLLSGTTNKTSSEIATEIDFHGGFVFKNSDYYTSSLTIYGMNEKFKILLELVKEYYENCIYSLDELSVFKERKISELNINLGKTSFLANRGINQLILGEDHPYSKPVDQDIIRSIESSQLLDYKKNNLIEPYFLFTGSASTEAEKIIEKIGYNLKSFVTGDLNEIIPQETSETEKKIIKQDSNQSSIRMGKIMPSREDEDYFKISMCNLILGGYFGSRLMKNIREEKGLTYGIHSSITPFKNFSLFKISSECNSELSETVRQEIINELKILQTDLVPEEELTTAKNYLSGHMMRNFDGAFNISDRLKGIMELDTKDPDAYYKNYFDTINKVTSEEIREIANNYLNINTLKYCISGAN